MNAMRLRPRRLAGSMLYSVLTVLVILVFLIPVLAIVLTSFKNRLDALAYPPKFLFMPTFQNFRDIFTLYPFWAYLRNSVLVTTLATFFALVLGTPAAYALARFQFKKRENLAFWILSLRMTPPIAAIIPYFILLRLVTLTDKPAGLILIYMTFNVPFVVWMMRGFFEEIPRSIEEAALVEGCDHFGAFFRVALPLVRTGVAATAILTFLFTWNEFLFALILTSTDKAMTLPVAVTLFMRETGIEWGNTGAAAVVMFLPMFFATLAVQRYLVRGLTFGAVK